MRVYGIELDVEEQDFLIRLWNEASKETGYPNILAIINMFEPDDKKTLGIANRLRDEGLIDTSPVASKSATFEGGFVSITPAGKNYR